MLRVIVGLIKGAVVGGGVAYALLRLGLGAPSTLFAYLACALVGALVGVVAGRAPWKAETIWTPVLKMVVGAGIGAGLAALGLHFLPDRSFTVSSLGAVSLASAPMLSLGVGIIYGMFVELDDGGDKAEPAVKKAKRA
ncbi:MAG: hypothetical protein ABI321_01730 [Polyangia bacterium]